jgi:hypothetical protein
MTASASALDAFVSEALGEAKDAKTRTKALFGMGAVAQDRVAECARPWP